MSADRLKWVRIEGLRSLRDVTLEISDLQVLVGENGAGKSTVIEAFEILSLLVQEPRFTIEFAARHGDLRELLFRGAQVLRLSMRVESIAATQDQPETVPLNYTVELAPAPNGPYPIIVKETLVGADVVDVFNRDATVLTAQFHAPRAGAANPTTVAAPTESSALRFWGGQVPIEVGRVARVLEGIRIHVPFETRPPWVRQQPAVPTLRSLAQLEQSEQLERGGINLASIYQQLSAEGSKRREEVVQDIQLGLGEDVTDFAVVLKGPFAQLALRIAGFGTIPAAQLSEGQLAYLGLVALRHFEDPKASIVLFDEPELHLHPALIVRAAYLFERMSARLPVIVATHSEAFFEAVSDPVAAIRVLTLQGRETVLRRLSAQKLDEWKELYAGIGDARREGRLQDLFAEPSTSRGRCSSYSRTA